MAGINGMPTAAATDKDMVLEAYLLGTVDFDAALVLQRRLVYQVAGERRQGALVLCEHPPLITVGRQGSRAHIQIEPEELHNRRWPVRWVNRGGGCLLHVPGQLAAYSILALDQHGLGLQAYLERLQQVVIALLDDFSVEGRPGPGGVWVEGRPIAAVTAAVRNWVTYFGVVLNVAPDLTSFRRVLWASPGSPAMTSLERERRGRLRPSFLRERLLEHFAGRFGFGRTSLFFEHPAISKKAPFDAVATRPY